MLVEGSEDLDIPPLDPAKLDHLDLDVNEKDVV